MSIYALLVDKANSLALYTCLQPRTCPVETREKKVPAKTSVANYLSLLMTRSSGLTQLVVERH